MALHTLGSKTTTSLQAITYGASSPAGGSVGSGQLSPADLAAIAQAITSDVYTAANQALNITGPQGIVATGTTHSNTTLDTLVSVAGSPLSAIGIGWIVLGIGIVPGTYTVSAAGAGTSVTLNQAATTGSAGTNLIFVPPSEFSPGLNFNGQLVIPNRGILKVLPGDVVAIDNTGWPIMVSAASVGYTGSQWTYT